MMVGLQSFTPSPSVRMLVPSPPVEQVLGLLVCPTM